MGISKQPKVLVNGLCGTLNGKLLFEVMRGALRSLSPEQRRDRRDLVFVVSPLVYQLLREEVYSHSCAHGTQHPMALPWDSYMGVQIREVYELQSGADWELCAV